MPRKAAAAASGGLFSRTAARCQALCWAFTTQSHQILQQPHEAGAITTHLTDGLGCSEVAKWPQVTSESMLEVDLALGPVGP